MDDEPKADVALLTPVPEMHLNAGLGVCAATGFVVFGSDAGMTLSELRQLVDPEHAADILFYGSHTHNGGPPAATFRGRFVDYDGAVAGKAKASWTKHRPPTTETDGPWLSFYLVSGLHKLETPVPISSLTKRGNKGKLAKNFVPEGPLIIDTPF